MPCQPLEAAVTEVDIDSELAAHLKSLYSAYRRTEDIDAKGLFFSPRCAQICRPQPSYAATSRDEIVQYLHDVANNKSDVVKASLDNTESEVKKKGYYTIRPLKKDEVDFGSDEMAGAAGFRSAQELKQKAEKDGWVGMRVDLWNDDGSDDQGKPKGLLVKVQYWWAKEGDGWLQILHHIMYMGPRDGTEGTGGGILE
ncbi:hypothetical protein jhhlp_008882 [Lomentospora prolificans]|uniref:SnoaL-like domain-containing protein n=1 Tax=Lomentospora prolificans TaxID=41688 RepID=A0A2N3MZ89_9PEZI|nr:hypothetical protein jhhlp_008882 [Lomentospora prolificans]